MVAAMVTVTARAGEARRLLGCRRAPTSARSWSPGPARRRSPRWTTWPARKCSSARAAPTTRASSRLNAQLKAQGQAGGGDRRGARRCSKTTTCSRWSMPAWSRSRSSTTTWREFWSQVFTDITVHQDVARADRRRAGRGVPQGQSQAAGGRQRRGSRSTARATRSGTCIEQPVPQETSSSPRTPRPRPSARSSRRWSSCSRSTAAQYNLDYLLMAAQGYQESTLDQNVKSPVGAIGVMQVMPATGKELSGRRHQPDRAQHPRRREVHALHDGHLLQGRADGQPQQGADDVRRLQRRARTHAAAAARGGEEGARSRTCGSTTSSGWPRSGSAARPSPTSATSTSTTSPTAC